MPETAWREPSIFASGDTLKFSKYLPGYLPSAGWSLLYVLTKPTATAADLVAQATSTTSTTDGDSHAIEVDNFGSTLDAGEYILTGYAVKAGGERHQIYCAELTLDPDRASGNASAPVKTWLQQMQAVLEAKLLRLEAIDLSESDVQRSKFVWEERTKTLERLNIIKEQRNHEVNAQGIRNGHGDNRLVGVVFNIA